MKDREAWLAAIHGAAKSWTQLSDSTAEGHLGCSQILAFMNKAARDVGLWRFG